MVSAPRRARPARNWLDLSDGLSFHLQIHFRVPVRGCRTGMTQQMADRRQINARLQQRYRRAVPHAVRMESLLAEIRDSSRQARSRHWARMWRMPNRDKRLHHDDSERRALRPQIQISCLAERSQDRGRLRPQRTVALLPALCQTVSLEKVWSVVGRGRAGPRSPERGLRY